MRMGTGASALLYYNIGGLRTRPFVGACVWHRKKRECVAKGVLYISLPETHCDYMGPR